MISYISSRCPQCGHPVPEHAVAGLCPACLLGGALETGRTRAQREEGPEWPAEKSSISDYQILERLGYGGMGIVFAARRPGDRDPVAIKTIAAGDLAAPQDVRRFRLEAEAISKLDHPHIVPVYEVGDDAGRHYFVMKLARGGSLADRGRLAEENGGEVMPVREAVVILVKVARGIHFAHQRGILHRDLKPGNILLDADGEPMVADFGLAKLVHGSAELTLAGAALGTPSYMAPEQAGGDPDQITTAADLYSLGAILYFLLTGRPPLTAPSTVELLRRIGTEIPQSPRRRSAGTDRDLELICLKCLEKNPASRYLSAGTLADDLERWLAGEPIEARPATKVERVRRWARRRPVLAATSLLGAIATLTLAAVLAGATVLLQRQRNLAREAEQDAREMAAHAGAQAERAEKSRQRTRLNLYAADLFLTGHAIGVGNFGLARTSLRRHLPQPGEEDLRGFEWFAYNRLCAGQDRLTLTGHAGAVTALAFDPSGDRLASVSRDETVRFWSSGEGEMTGIFPAENVPSRPAEYLLFPRLIAKSPEASRYLFSQEGTFDEIRMRSRPSCLGELTAVAWSHGGDLLATGGLGSYLRLWNVESATLGGIIPVGFAKEIAFTRDDSRLVVAVEGVGGAPSEIRIYDTKSLERQRTLPDTRPCFSLSMDGSRLAVVHGYREVKVQDLESGESLRRWTVPETVHRLALSPDGKLLATLEDAGRSLAFWEIPSGRSLARFKIAPDHFNALAFAPGGDTLVAAGSDHSLRLYDPKTFRERGVLRGHDDEVLSLAFPPNGEMFASGGNDHSVRMWSLRDLQSSREVTNCPGSPCALSPNGTHLLVSTAEEGVICGTVSGARKFLVESVQPLGFSADSASYTVLRRGSEGAPLLESRSVAGHEAGESLELRGIHHPWSLAGAQGPEGLLALGTDHGVVLYDIRTGKRLQRLEKSQRFRQARFRFAPDGSRVGCLVWPRRLIVWDCASGRKLSAWSASAGTIAAFAFSPDGRMLASGGDDNLVSVWDAASGDRVATLRGHKGEVKGLAFSPDGRTLASSGRDLTLRLWHVPTWRDLGVLRRGEFFSWLSFGEDGESLLASGGKVLRLIRGSD